MSQTLERQPTEDKPARVYASYKPADVERGLHALAMCGTPKRAAEQTGIPESTLRRWQRELHPERYQAIRERVMPQIHAEIASESEDLARLWAELERNGLQDLQDNWDKLKPGEKSSALRNATVSRGISIDKMALLRGRPTSIVENRTPDEILRKLASANVVDGTADEIVEAEGEHDTRPGLREVEYQTP